MNICYYCKKEEANDKSRWYEHELYYIPSKTGISYRYTSHKVLVPRCKACDKVHTNSYFQYLIFFVIVFAITLLISLSRIDDVAAAIFISFFLAAVISGVIKIIYDLVLHDKVYKIPAEEIIDEYPEVKKMLDEGWVLSKPDPSDAETAKENREFREFMRKQESGNQNKT